MKSINGIQTAISVEVISRRELIPLYVDDVGIRGGSHRIDPPCAQPPEDEIEAAAAWLSVNVIPTKTKSPHFTSYSLKHEAEDGSLGYVSNGAFIVALNRVGIVQTWDGKTPNTIPHCRLRP